MSKTLEGIKNLIKKMWSQAPDSASRDLLELYHTNARLDGCRIIANKCASTELYLYDKADFRKNKSKAEVIEKHEIYDLLENPCPIDRDLNGWTIRYFVFACYTLVGEAYLLKVRDPMGKVIGLQPVAPSWVIQTPTVNQRFWEIYPFGTAGGNSIVVPVEDVISFKDIDLNDPYGRGRGTSEAIGDEIQSDEYASKYAKNLFFNDATPSAIIYAPQGTKETADQIKQSWIQKMAGFRHAKEPMVLTGEGSKFEKISQTPTELDFVESRRFLRDNANEHFHIPPEIMGILQNSNRSTIDSAEYLLNKNVLADYLRMFERSINNQLLWEDFDKERKFILYHENNIAEDIQQKLQIANDGLSRGVLTVNDWRIAMGYEADERGGDVYLRGFGQVEVPFNSEPIELPDAEPTEQIELPEGSTEESPETELPEKEFEALSKAYEKKYKVLKSDADKERRGKIWKVFDARARSIEEPFYKAMQTAFTKQNEEVNKTIRKACEENKDVGTAIENLYNKEMDKKLLHTMAGAFFNGLTVGAEHGLELLNKKGVKEISEETRRLFNIWIDTYGLNLAKDIDDTTKKKLRKALSESIEEGEDLKKRVAKLIEVSDEMFAEDKKWRAELIARTESCTTMNAGAIELYRSEDISMKEWISVQDDRTRDSHLLMDGVVVPITDKFEVPATSQSEGAFMEYAGDPSAPAGQVCNCRCTVAPFVMM
jgi:HK97 family phage portal protein